MQTYKVKDLIVVYYNSIKITKYLKKTKYNYLKKHTIYMRDSTTIFLYSNYGK